MNGLDIAYRMADSGYVDAAIVSNDPGQTVDSLISTGWSIEGHEVVDGETIFFLNPPETS